MNSTAVESDPDTPGQPIEPSGLKIRFAIRTIAKAGLFCLTMLSSTAAGAFLLEHDPFSNPSSLVHGLPFSAALLSVFLAHCGTHCLVASHFGIRSDLPWILPAFPILTGTNGFVDVLPETVKSQKARVMVGLSGPVAGATVSAILLAFGLHLSGLAESVADQPYLEFGEPWLYKIISNLVIGPVPDNVDVWLHPVGIAGWFGILWSAFHLIPVEPLDGGYVSRAVFGTRHRWISTATIGTLAILGFSSSAVWLSAAFWLAMGTIARRWIPWLYAVLFLRLPSPDAGPIEDDLARKDAILLMVAATIVFALCFSPVPLVFVDP